MSESNSLLRNIVASKQNVSADVTQVIEMAKFSFGEDVTEMDIFKTKLHVIIRDFGFELRKQACPDSISAIHPILLRHGINIKQLKKFDLARMFFDAAYIFLAYNSAIHDNEMISDVDRLMKKYPEFNEVGFIELKDLLRYRNIMAVALKYIKPSCNRDYLLNMISRISEGRDAKYVGGSGATQATKHRLLIYHMEGLVPLKERPPRISRFSPDANNSASKKRKRGRLQINLPTNSAYAYDDEPPTSRRRSSSEYDDKLVSDFQDIAGDCIDFVIDSLLDVEEENTDFEDVEIEEPKPSLTRCHTFDEKPCYSNLQNMVMCSPSALMDSILESTWLDLL